MGIFGKRCNLSPNNAQAQAPDPSNWELIDCWQLNHAYVLHVKYPNCTNFGGAKILVFRGIFEAVVAVKKTLDPHFSISKLSPIARFKPDEAGIENAICFASQQGGL